MNIDKSNFVIFYPPQKNVRGLNLKINDQQLNREFFIKYLGVMIDSNLNWKNMLNLLLKRFEEVLESSAKSAIMFPLKS